MDRTLPTRMPRSFTSDAGCSWVPVWSVCRVTMMTLVKTCW